MSITSASIQIGIFDHDSASPGSQLALFDFDGNNLTTGLDGLFEASGGGFSGLDPEYNVYTLAITSFGDLLDGSSTFQLDLQGPVENPNLFPLPSGSTTSVNDSANVCDKTRRPRQF